MTRLLHADAAAGALFFEPLRSSCDSDVRMRGPSPTPFLTRNQLDPSEQHRSQNPRWLRFDPSQRTAPVQSAVCGHQQEQGLPAISSSGAASLPPVVTSNAGAETAQ